MAETNATILIPDISGFTEFMTSTELSHSSRAIHMLIDAMLTAIGDEYEVSEIEGDAVLLIKKGPAPPKQEILNICLKIFNAFHFQRKWMEQYTVCPCGACQAITGLSLKFVVHHGPLAEIRVGRFTKQSGTEMIVAHRLLKNSINNNEYLLMTEKLLQQAPDVSEAMELEWTASSEEYPSIGKVAYRFALLDEAKRNVPDPPKPLSDYEVDDTSYHEVPIDANFMDVYMQIMDIPNRADWMPELEKVEQHFPGVFKGSLHYCTFNDYLAVLSPMRMTLSEDGICYAERCSIKEMNLSIVHEYVFRKTGEDSCIFATRFLNASESPVPDDVRIKLQERMQRMGESLKARCEAMKVV
ncbi:MAG TPA: DUF2652 domain-containing protein [Chitinophagaceae bacterium]